MTDRTGTSEKSTHLNSVNSGQLTSELTPPARSGCGYEFSLPLAAIKFSAPRRPTDAQKAQLARARAARQEPRFGAGELVATTSPAHREGEGVS